PIQCLGEPNRSADRSNQSLVDGLLPIGVHELSDAAQGTLNEGAFVRDTLVRQDRGVQRSRVAQEDILRAPHEEQASRPVCKRVLIQGQGRQGSCLDLGVQLLREAENHGIFSYSGHSLCSGTATNASPARTMIGSGRSTQPPSPTVAVASRPRRFPVPASIL